MTRFRPIRFAKCIALVLALWGVVATPLQARDLVVFAAASLKTALDEVAQSFSAQTGQSVVASYGGSSVLARQIGFGAPADVFISASTEWMDDLDARGLIRADTRFDLLGNRLVLIAHGQGGKAVALDDTLDLMPLLGGRRLAMALVEAVPAGIYGKAAWQALGIWPQIEGALAQTDNVRAALALVATGETRLGVVYITDAKASDAVSVIAQFPEGSHPPIVYPVAAVEGDAHPGAEAFLNFLKGDVARTAFERHGFAVLAQ